MKSRKIVLAVAALVAAAGSAMAQDDAKIWFSWSPKPVPLTPWAAPNKPIWRLSEILAAHKGKTDWVQPIVRDQDYHADYISMGAGQKTKPQFWADDRIFWYVASGQVRFTIQGQEPFVASKGFLVQVPYRNVFSLEVVGDKPALFLEVNAADAQTLYPIDETPVPVPGTEFVKVRITGRGSYDERNKPFLDFNALVASNGRAGAFVVDDRAFANIIRGMPQADNPKDKGHFHEVSA